MELLFDAIASRLTRLWKPNKEPKAGRSYRCRCGQPVFFRNSVCLTCETPLGYEPHLVKMVSIEPIAQDNGAATQYLAQGAIEGTRYRRCENFESPAGCNWLIRDLPDQAADPHDLCIACRLNRTIPDLSTPENGQLWGKTEMAKRRLVSLLLALGLPVKSRETEDSERGLMFDILRADPDDPPIITSHTNGLITLDVQEADDAVRERIRAAMREPYRTLLGHFRHEIGHYYWDRLVRDTRWLTPFREVFGDDQQDYAESLRKNYEQGPAADWAQQYISSYASTHPWEDWAETWAHYLHLIDTVDTALSFGLEANDVELDIESYTKADLYDPDDATAKPFVTLLNSWLELIGVLNEMSRSMGQPDFYPFVMPHAAVRKLHFIHMVVTQAGRTERQPR